MPTPLSPEVAIQLPDFTVKQLGEVITHVQATCETERVKVARALHDDLGGMLVSAVMDLGWIEQHVEPGELTERLRRVRGALAAAIDLKRNLIEDLRPSLLDNFGLFAAYRWHVKATCKREGVGLAERYPLDELDLNDSALAGLFRIMQEMLAVVLAEPMVNHVDVEAVVDEGSLKLQTRHEHQAGEVEDVFLRRPGPMGAMVRRVHALGGQFTLSHAADSTIFAASFPLEALMVASPTSSQPATRMGDLKAAL